MKNILFAIILLATVSCKSTKTSSAETTSASTCAVKISFGSMGSGIDGNVYDQVKTLIEEKKLKFTEKTMGREGEKEICLPLSELKSGEKKTFIDQLKNTTSGGQMVSLSTN
jgi:hypothetical protein